jgi:hypothetical protein
VSDSIRFDSEAALDIERLAPGAVDPDHHLWRNGRLWWIAFTVHRGHQQERVRFSLETDDVVEARRLRDRALALCQQARDCEVSLRFAARRARQVRS